MQRTAAQQRALRIPPLPYRTCRHVSVRSRDDVSGAAEPPLGFLPPAQLQWPVLHPRVRAHLALSPHAH